jgi:hypothetical protein
MAAQSGRPEEVSAEVILRSATGASLLREGTRISKLFTTPEVLTPTNRSKFTPIIKDSHRPSMVY